MKKVFMNVTNWIFVGVSATVITVEMIAVKICGLLLGIIAGTLDGLFDTDKNTMSCLKVVNKVHSVLSTKD